MNRRIGITSIIGVVVIFATVAIYALVQPVVYPCTILGFSFLIYGELVLFGGYSIVEYLAGRSSQIMMRTGVGIPVASYALAVIVTSFVYMNSHSIFIRVFLILQIVMAALTAILVVIFVGISKGRYERDAKVLHADAMVHGFVDELELIRELSINKSEIDKLIEGIRYSDTSVMVDADVELNDEISRLEEIVRSEASDNTEFDRTVKNIQFLIKKRNLQTRNGKHGGI